MPIYPEPASEVRSGSTLRKTMASHHQAMPQRHDEILKWDVVPEGTSHPEEEQLCHEKIVGVEDRCSV